MNGTVKTECATILVVDDEPDLELLITQKFRQEIRSGEWVFLFARDGQEALDVLEREREVDLVLADINMPRMDGLTLLRHMGELEGDLRAVIVSAYGDLRNIRKAMNLGAFDFVTKPIEFEDLTLTMRKTLDDLRKLREAHRLREAAERAKLVLSRYFSPNLARQLAENPESVNLSGERRDLTFVFTDVADFTALVETLEPAAIVPLLNEYLHGMTQVVFRHEGTVDKIVGDSIHAMFGAPAALPDHTARAVACALEMDAFAEAFRERRVAEGTGFGLTRIGVHSGPAIVGNFGGEVYFDYTAHGDAVNTAARLEGANKHLGTRICVSEQVVAQMAEFSGRPIGTLVLKGKGKALRAFEPIDPERAEAPLMQAYRAAFEELEAGSPDARQAFAAVVGRFGEDPLSTFHLRRLLAGEDGTRIVLEEK